MTAALILTGAPGSGKTSVLEALSTSLEIDRIPFGAIETEQLARGWPWLTPEQWVSQLTSVVELQRTAGRDLFLVAATTENEQELQAVVDAIGATRVVVVCLAVAPELAAQRVSEREPDRWPGKPALVGQARRLAGEILSIPGIDVVVPTAHREPEQVAAQVRELLVTRGLLPGA